MIYTIQKGDTLSALAKRFNTTVEALARTNNIKNPDKIYAGKTLSVPSPATSSIWDAVKRLFTWPGF
jgi:LysM repeat protein